MKRFREPSTQSVLSKTTSDDILIHEQAEDMPHIPVARFTRFPKTGNLAGYSPPPVGIHFSEDDGKTWYQSENFPPTSHIQPSPSGAFRCTSRGTLIAAFCNIAEKTALNWDPETKDAPGVELPTYIARSVDGGNTWEDVQKLHTEWTGANRDMIETSQGRIVFTSMKIRHNPGRHTVLTYYSDDDGKTWTPSNVIDLGGNGHHGGVTEATLEELQDGSLLKYIRTNWGQFWRALSYDGGESWHPYGPAGIDASSTPGALVRLQSGRLALAWNREFPEDKRDYPLKGGDGIWSATPTSNLREELSISFSEDEAETWSPPTVIARTESSEVSYPYIFEPSPGKLWITTQRWKLRMQISENDFVT